MENGCSSVKIARSARIPGTSIEPNAWPGSESISTGSDILWFTDLLNSQRRQEKSHHYAHGAHQGLYDTGDYRSYAPAEGGHAMEEMDGEGSYDEGGDSEDDRHFPRRYSPPDVDSADEDARYYTHMQRSPHTQGRRYERSSSNPYSRGPAPAPSYQHSQSNSGGRYKLSPQAASLVNRHKVSGSSYALRRAPSAEDVDDVSMDEDVPGDDDVDMDDEEYRRERSIRYDYAQSRRMSREYSHSRSQPSAARPNPPLADLRTANGR